MLKKHGGFFRVSLLVITILHNLIFLQDLRIAILLSVFGNKLLAFGLCFRR